MTQAVTGGLASIQLDVLGDMWVCVDYCVSRTSMMSLLADAVQARDSKTSLNVHIVL